MYFLKALMEQNNDLTQRYNLNIVIVIDGLEKHENGFICPHLNFYEMPSYLVLARYLPAAMSVFINSLPNIQCNLYVVSASSLIVSKEKVGLQNPLLLKEPLLFHNIQEKIERATGPKKYQEPFNLSDYWRYQPLDQFIPIDKSFCLFVDHLQDDIQLKNALTRKIIFFNHSGAIIPHHASFEGFFNVPESISRYCDTVYIQNKPDFSALKDTKEFHVTSPTAAHNPQYIAIKNEKEYHAAFAKQQAYSVDGMVKIYPQRPYCHNRKMIKVHTVGTKILPMGFETLFKYHKKGDFYRYETKKKPFILDAEILRNMSLLHKNFQSYSSIYQTYYIYQSAEDPKIYRLHKTVSSDAQGYTKIAIEMEKRAKALKRSLRKMPDHILHHIDILPINHLIYIPIFNQFMRQKNARFMNNVAQDIEDTLGNSKNNLKSGS